MEWTLCPFFAFGVQYVMHMLEDRTFVVFFTEDTSLQLLENVPESIGGVDNVKFEELTSEEVQNEIAGDKELAWLKYWVIDPTDKLDPADQSEEVLEKDDDDDDEKKSE